MSVRALLRRARHFISGSACSSRTMYRRSRACLLGPPPHTVGWLPMKSSDEYAARLSTPSVSPRFDWHALCVAVVHDISRNVARDILLTEYHALGCCGALVADMITCRCSFARLARLTLYRLPCAVRDGSRCIDILFASRRCGALALWRTGCRYDHVLMQLCSPRTPNFVPAAMRCARWLPMIFLLLPDAVARWLPI
eukprot:scaffold43502_cov92-Phaeocystis_antarctica.AAC.2